MWALVGVAVLAGCGDPLAPWPEPPATPLRPRVIEEWEADRPHQVQRGVFTWSDDGRLTRYEFGLVQPDGSLHTTMYLTNEYVGDRLTRSDGYAWDVDHFVHVRETEYTYDAAGRLVLRLIRSLSETGGEVQESTTSYEYDASGRLVARTTGSERETFTYDARGNVSRLAFSYGGVPSLEMVFTHEATFNPLPPPSHQYDGIVLNSGIAFGDYNIARWTSGEPGKAPAATVTIASQVNDQGYPVRREMTVINAAQPDVPHVIIATFTYE